MSYDWYKTKTIGELAAIKKQHKCVWCPRCGGTGREKKPIDSLFDMLFNIVRKEKACTRCNGRTIIAARQVTDAELWKLMGLEQGLVMAVRQYPAVRKDYLKDYEIREIKKKNVPATPLMEYLEQLEQDLKQKSITAMNESLRYPTGSSGWASARVECHGYERSLHGVEILKRKLQTGEVKCDV